MATEVQNHTDQSVTSLVGGIVSDIQDLIKQQLRLTREEIEEDFRKAKEAASIFLLGTGILLLGVIVFCLMLVHLLHWLTAPGGTDPAWLPLWSCHAIVAAFLLAFGGGLAYVGRGIMKSIHPLENPATDALKENVQWLTTPK